MMFCSIIILACLFLLVVKNYLIARGLPALRLPVQEGGRKYQIIKQQMN